MNQQIRKASRDATQSILNAFSRLPEGVRAPETGLTFQRLLSMGYQEREAQHLIANVLSGEMTMMQRFGEPFNQERYAAMLRQLPRQNWRIAR
ncbi:MAG: hypothetical protein HQL50_15895 [Magnetococcales bacterium]|nr:hypothetical protein [Magnetococcales bacterium]